MPRNQPGRLGTVVERFWRKVSKGGPNDCGVWTAATNLDGYGRFFLGEDRKRSQAHRFSWRLANGPIPDGLSVCHHCDNPPCVNPAHLFLGTHAENMLDRDQKGRRPPPVGERNGRAKLLAAEVACVRVEHAAGLSVAELALKYGVSKSTIGSITRGTTWKAA